jgi:hypothetical protein
MSYLIENIMEISEKQIRSPTPFNDLPNTEETDCPFEIQSEHVANGHGNGHAYQHPEKIPVNGCNC